MFTPHFSFPMYIKAAAVNIHYNKHEKQKQIAAIYKTDAVGPVYRFFFSFRLVQFASAGNVGATS